MQEQDMQTDPSPSEDRPLAELLAEAQAKLELQRDSMMRALADAENARKRAQTEAAAAQKYALERFAEQLLPVVDSLQAALDSENTSPEALRSGVELTLKQLGTALERANLREIAPAKGERFDPHRHHAMAAVEARSCEPNTVVSLMQKGYMLHDRVLRPALVTVAKGLESGDRNPISDIDLD
ncbi:MAG: nucleotide exchange factor GrpE [Betaproteobacteria bacterium]|nr:MAG: nucleotide exchange factor GrpE [Betaproteobacteria bacterium]